MKMLVWVLVFKLSGTDNATVLHFESQAQCQRAYSAYEKATPQVRWMAPCVEALR